MGKKSRFDISCCYVVEWPNGMVKVGITERQRYKKFMQTGAKLRALIAGCCYHGELDAETFGHEFMARRGNPAFSSGQEAARLLPRDGGGWKECYIGLTEPDVTLLVSMLTGIATEHCRAAMPSSSAGRHATDGRTHGLTDVVVTSVGK